MKDTEVKKRGWVKNAAIVFLAGMLVLTFFSNTIMNRSLPEVAAQYTTSGTITARIRGSGTVTANESFEVMINQTRMVSEVPVRKGDEVKIGEVLIRLTGIESEELKGAKEALRAAERQLEEELLKVTLGDGSVADAVRAVQNARNSLDDSLRALSDAQQTLSNAQAMLSGINYSEAAYNAALTANNQAQAAVNAAAATESARQYDLSIAKAELNVLGPSPDDGGLVDPDVYDAAVQKVRDATFAWEVADAALAAANSAAAGPKAELAVQEQSRARWLDANDTVRSANSAVGTANSAVRGAQISLDAANANLNLVQQSENVSGSLDSIKLRELRRDLVEAKEKVEELEKEGTGTEITSLVGGIVTDVNVTAGRETDPNNPLMVIEVVDRGYSLTFNVTSEQASKVTIGDNAEVDRGWWSWGEEIRATLIAIRNDPQNPVAGRILHFSISGDVESGTQLNVVLNQRSENYSVIIPNSALRTDTNGDFVLVVMSRSSPLGNRYIATRVDVTVLASDDTHTAVAGGLSGWDFVITTATAPIEPGMQVRLVDNP